MSDQLTMRVRDLVADVARLSHQAACDAQRLDEMGHWLARIRQLEARAGNLTDVVGHITEHLAQYQTRIEALEKREQERLDEIQADWERRMQA